MRQGQAKPEKSAAKPATRRKGRPTASAEGVGRDALIDAARALLQELPPAQVTSTAIARKANADPALVRYYFGNRENLLFEVAKQIGEEANRPLPPGRPAQAARGHDPRHVPFHALGQAHAAPDDRGTRFRLVARGAREDARVEPETPVANYARILEFDEKGELREFDPFFMYLAVVGISDFFVAGAPLIELLVPPGTNKDDLAKRYEEFVVRLITDGVRKR
jgi:AcrR family transcriptional regulator